MGQPGARLGCSLPYQIHSIAIHYSTGQGFRVLVRYILMNTITLSPEAALPGLPLPLLDQVWVAARDHIISFNISGPERTACWRMKPGTCFLALDVVADESQLAYHRQELHDSSLPMPLFQVTCEPRHRLAMRVWEELPEAELVVVARFAGTDQYVVHGLESAVRLLDIKWPRMNREGDAYCALQLGTLVPQASALLPASLAYTLHGRTPQLTAVSATTGCGVFQHRIRLSGQHLFGTRRVWWGAEACEFATIWNNGAYELEVIIPPGDPSAHLPFQVMNQAGSCSSPFVYRRY